MCGTICGVYKIVVQSLMVGTGWRCEWATLAPVLGVGHGKRGTSGQGRQKRSRFVQRYKQGQRLSYLIVNFGLQDIQKQSVRFIEYE